jgi:SNF2 family DNA or RNA helicase
LIIAPLALVRQWEEEIHKKTKITHKLSVFIYHNKKATTDELLLHDVVLTTYGTIATELKRLEKFLKDNEGREIDFNDRTLTLRCPLLHPKKASFYRVILDEAQCIKNKDTQTAKACHKLKATHRWCLTGTPMMNGVLELHSLVCFLKIKPYCHWEQFRSVCFLSLPFCSIVNAGDRLLVLYLVVGATPSMSP